MLCAFAVLCAGLSACGGRALEPVAVDPHNDACAWCRMAVSNPKLAGEIVAPGEEPLIFDDLGCMMAYARARKQAPGAVMYVADHRTGAWVPAHTAILTRVPSIETPMDSHLVAHADAASRDSDLLTGPTVSVDELTGGTR